jgi:serine protease Do
MAVYVAKALMAHGKVERAWLGVSVQDVTPEVAKSAGIEERKGALIAEVVKGGPAEQAGLRRGDVVIAYGGKDVTDASALRNAVAATPIGHEVQVTVLRGGQTQELTAKVGNLAEANKALLAAVEKHLGVEVRPVTSKEAERYGLDRHQGVTITHVAPNGAMGKAGFEVQDILLAIDGQSIDNAESLVALTAALKPQQRITVLALDHRSGNTGDVQVIID